MSEYATPKNDDDEFDLEAIPELQGDFQATAPDVGGIQEESSFTTEGDNTEPPEETQEDESVYVPVKEYSIERTLDGEQFDDFSTMQETEIQYPYFVFEARGNLNTIVPLCTNILTKGDIQLYFRPDGNDLAVMLPVAKISATPKNVRNILRLASKGSARYRRNEPDAETPISPEQFVRTINLGLKEDDSYWQELIAKESTPQTSSDMTLEEIFGE